MKKTILAAILFAVTIISFTSCDFFFTKKTKSSPSIVGLWKMDSVYSIGKDSNSLISFAFALSKSDSTIITIQFNADSTYKESDTKDSSLKKYYVKDQQIFIQEDSTLNPFTIRYLTDSSASLLTKDSTAIDLKKIK